MAKQKVTGIGEILFKARDPQSLAACYRKHLGIPVGEGKTYAMFTSGDTGTSEQTVWSALPDTTTYFRWAKRLYG